jgi:hypothetical protein
LTEVKVEYLRTKEYPGDLLKRLLEVSKPVKIAIDAIETKAVELARKL